MTTPNPGTPISTINKAQLASSLNEGEVPHGSNPQPLWLALDLLRSSPVVPASAASRHFAQPDPASARPTPCASFGRYETLAETATDAGIVLRQGRAGPETIRVRRRDCWLPSLPGCG